MIGVQSVAGVMIESLVIFDLLLEAVTRPGHIDGVAFDRHLGSRLSAAPVIDGSGRQLKEAVHRYRHLHLALGDLRSRDLPYLY